MKIVALSGWKGSGKDTLANYLVDRYGFKRLAFADPLKDMVSEEYGIPRSHLDDPAFKEKPILSLPISPRDAFSRHIHDFLIGEFRKADGTPPAKPYPAPEGGRSLVETVMDYQGPLYWTPRALAIFKGSGNRAISNSYWVERAAKEAAKNPSGLYVISDLRFCSEAYQLLEFAGRDRVSLIRVERFDSSPSTDPSERDMDDFEFDCYINNRGSKEESFQALEFVLGLTT